jgi:excisionase family DNA binding protein
VNILPLGEAAKRLGLSHSTLRWQIHNGALEAMKIGHIWVVTEQEVERYRSHSLRGSTGEVVPS